MADRIEKGIVLSVLAAAACVLAAPVIGRLGAPALADVAMWIAAGCGVASFGLAGVATIRAARQGGRRDEQEARE